MEALLDSIGHIHPVYISVFVAVMRFAAPALAAIILWRCCKGLLTFKKEPEVWAWLQISGGKKVPVTHWENVIGRSKRSDIVIDFPTVSRTHAVLTRYDDGSWSIADVDSKDGVYVGGKKVIRRHPELLRTVQIEEAELFDCDTPQALEELKRAGK